MQLSQYSHGGGCGCKISPDILKLLLQNQHTDNIKYENLLVGLETNDDSAVYKINEKQAIVNSLDFFPPLIDDPYLYGRIAACNAVSDIYAMGGDPIIAMAIFGMPIDKISIDIMREILSGGRSVCEEINIPLAGGHSIDLTEPIYGLSVTGLVDLCNLKKNNSSHSDDAIILSKPIGVGIISTAIKNKIISSNDSSNDYRQFVNNVTKINSVGSQLAKINDVSAMTDVTGFGLIGHLLEMAIGSNLTAKIEFNLVPIIDIAIELAMNNRHTSGATRNYEAYTKYVSFSDTLDDWKIKLLYDPQTNGGLLLTVSKDAVEHIQTQLIQAGFSSSVIGYMSSYRENHLIVND